MAERLIGDIGGTHSRLALCDAGIRRVRVYDNAGFGGIEEVLRAYLDDLQNPPSAAALAVAAPVRGDRVRLINSGWSFSTVELRNRLGLETLQVLNDFAAVALAIPVLGADDLFVIAPGEARPERPAGILGPGTGLGVSALIPCGERRVAVAGEGGHVTLAPATKEEGRLIETLRKDIGHVSAERLLSGPGMVLLYRLLAGDGRADISPEVITRRAVAGEDPIAVRTLDHFLAMLATVAGNLALTLGAEGGIYLAGGILPQLAGDLDWTGFRERFVDKGRYRDYLARIPVYLMTREYPALAGLQAQLDRPHE